MVTQIARQTLTRTLLVFTVIAVLSGYYFGQVDVAGFQIGLGHSTLQSERGFDSDAWDRAHPGGYR